jgi:hypothetical protein
MSAPTPKVGDRVRCTLGESVLVGEVTYLSTDASMLRVDINGNVPGYLIRWGDWTVKVLHPPVPDVEGVVVLDRDGDPWVRKPEGWINGGGGTGGILEDVVANYGPLKLVYTPEAAA